MPYVPPTSSGNYASPPPKSGENQSTGVVSNPGGTPIPRVSGNVMRTSLQGQQVPLIQPSYQQPYVPSGSLQLQTPLSRVPPYPQVGPQTHYHPQMQYALGIGNPPLR